MIKLSLCNHKGGAGKTTSAIHFAAALSMTDHRVLVVDLDPQGFLSHTLGVDAPQAEASAWMLFQKDTWLQDVPVIRMPHFDLIPASSAMTHLQRKLNRPVDVLWLKETLAGDLEYDFIILDTAAAITPFSLNALVAISHTIIPVAPEYQPVEGAEHTFQTVRMIHDKLNPDLEEPLFLITQVDGRKNHHEYYRDYLRQHYGDRVMQSEIRTSAALASHFTNGTSVFDLAPLSRGALDYANATDEFLRLVDRDIVARI